LKKSTYNGHLSADNHIHIHRHADELYTAGIKGILTSLDPTNGTYDFIIENPDGSGNNLEIVYMEPTGAVGFNINYYVNVDYPTGGTDVSPFNLNTITTDGDANVKHGDGIMDTTTGTQIPKSVVTGDKKGGGVFNIVGLDVEISPGETWAMQFELKSTPADVAVSCVLAEYEEGRTFIDE